MTEPNHISFKKKRQAYGITLNDISKESGLSMSTVGAYERFTSKYTETRVKDVNASKIENALNSIITERISNTFIGGKKMEETRTEEPGKVIVEKKFTANNINPAYDQKNYVPPEGICKTSNPKEICNGPVGQMFDVKYICQDGRYFREYKCVHIHKDELTKEEFIKNI